MKVRRGRGHIILILIVIGIFAVMLSSPLLPLDKFSDGSAITFGDMKNYLIVVGSVVLTFPIIFGLYCLFVKSFYIFTEDRIVFKKGSNIKTIIEYKDIKYVWYRRIGTMVLADPEGGFLVIHSVDSERGQIMISVPYKIVKKLPFRSIVSVRTLR